MSRIRRLADLSSQDASWAGSKATRLGRLMAAGFTVPAGIVVGADAYEQFVEQTDLRRSVLLLLGRKRFADMRWEEVWDLALRVRNLFARTPLPSAMYEELGASIEKHLGDAVTVVRSTAIGEDSATSSFAGLHDSFVNVRGVSDILDHVRLVWASLWSDRALLYRQELGLDPGRSRIAVVIQQLVEGVASGVAFSQSPTEPSESLVEGVWGLNQAMVDGTVSPHRWHLDRTSGQLKRAVSVEQIHALRVINGATRLVLLDAAEQETPPLTEAELGELFQLTNRIEALFGSPQDVEWTLTGDSMVILQARPITVTADSTDQRRWYLSLHRSLDNLKALRARIVDQILPGMEQEALELSAMELVRLDDRTLATEVERRKTIVDKWVDAYWRDCIPFAHGMRLFGQVYNDQVRPEDPFEFVDLLRGSELLGERRNRELRTLAAEAREIGDDAQQAEVVAQKIERFLEQYGLRSLVPTGSSPDVFAALLQQLAAHSAVSSRPTVDDDDFLARFSGEERPSMHELLELARESYRLRDDDNIYLGRIEEQLRNAIREAQRRVAAMAPDAKNQRPVADLVRLLEDPVVASLNKEPKDHPIAAQNLQARARQLVGQPASPGLAVGTARVILDSHELLSFREGEILVCDAIDPNMTFVAPLAAGVVERRGGMLIHGAIIAREYGIPAVTGVPEVVDWIQTGDTIAVDGHVGIVTVQDSGTA